VSRAPGAAPAASAVWVAPLSEQRGIALD
jgi:hypothetical protein